MEVLKMSKSVDRAVVAKEGELTLVTNSDENTLNHFTSLSTVSFVFSFSSLRNSFCQKITTK